MFEVARLAEGEVEVPHAEGEVLYEAVDLSGGDGFAVERGESVGLVEGVRSREAE